MNEVWDLSILYKDFDDPAFTGDMKALDEAIAAVNMLAGEAAGMEHSQLVHRFLQVQERVEELLRYHITQAVTCEAKALEYSDEAVRCGGTLKIHIKVDTGMSRLGFLCGGDHFETGVAGICAACTLPGLEACLLYTSPSPRD